MGFEIITEKTPNGTLRKIENVLKDGAFLEIETDNDGFNCVEVRFVNVNGERVERMVFPPEQALQVAKAMTFCAEEMLKEE